MNAVSTTPQTFLSLLATVLTAVFCVSCTESTGVQSTVALDRSESIIGGEVISSDDTSLNGVLKMDQRGCSSVQITDSLVLTAAHCTTYFGQRAEGAAFSWQSDNHQTSVGGEVFVHPLYVDTNLGHDLALAIIDGSKKLDGKDNFALPKSNDLPEELFIAGYGMTAFIRGDSEVDQLKKLKFSSSKQRIFEISNKTLDPSIDWNSEEKFQGINKHLKSGEFYCFKPLASDQGMPFSGDSGGPLYSVDKEGHKTVHGVFSIFLFAPSSANYYFYCYESIFSKVPWIKKSVEQKTKSGLLRNILEIKIGDRSLKIKNKFSVGVDISKARHTQGQIVDAGLGRLQDLEGKDLKGRILLIKRGEISFAGKLNNALRANPEIAGVIFYNNVDGDLFMPAIESGSYFHAQSEDLDMRLISKKDGENILNEINSGKTVEAQLIISGF